MNNLKNKLVNVGRTFLMIAFLSTISCSKDDKPNTTTSTFTNAFNGTYTGSGTDGASGPFTGDVVLNVTGGTTANITGAAGDYSISEIEVSAGGGYTGKTSAGASISLSFSGDGNKSIGIGGPFTFSGTKP
jgi:hypothetical protein